MREAHASHNGRSAPGSRRGDLTAAQAGQMRTGKQTLRQLLKEREISVVLIDAPGWLVRFCFGSASRSRKPGKACDEKGVIRATQLEPTEELLRTRLSLVTVFAARRYGHRANGV